MSTGVTAQLPTEVELQEKYTVQEFIMAAPHQILLQEITIKLRANIEDINLSGLHQFEADLKEKLKRAQNKQVVPLGPFGCNVTNSEKRVTRAAIVVAAMRDNFLWLGSFTKPFNFFNTVQFFLRKPPKLSTQYEQKAITYNPESKNQEHAQDQVDGRTRGVASVISHVPIVGPAIGCVANFVIGQIDKSKKKKVEQLCRLDKSGKDQDIGQTTSHTKATLIQKTEKSPAVINDDDIKVKKNIELAQGFAESEMILNKTIEKQKTLDEIFCETVVMSCDSQNRTLLADSVFNTIFLKNITEKDKISEEDEISEKDILNTLEKFGLEFNKNYLMKLITHKKYNLQHLNEHNISHREKSAIRKRCDEISSHLTICTAQKKAIKAIKNDNGKTHYEILIELIEEYNNQDLLTFISIVDVVFNEVFCNGKDPSKIETFEEVFNILKILEVQFNAEYLKNRILGKKRQLYDLAFSPKLQHSTQPEISTHKSTNSLPINKSKDPLPATNKVKTPPVTNTAFKSPLENVFSSKETYFCLFVIAASISILCLWHFPLGNVSILQELVPKEKREYIGLTLNIGLPILIALCVLNLAHFVYSEYSVESIGQNNSISRT